MQVALSEDKALKHTADGDKQRFDDFMNSIAPHLRANPIDMRVLED